MQQATEQTLRQNLQPATDLTLATWLVAILQREADRLDVDLVDVVETALCQWRHIDDERWVREVRGRAMTADAVATSLGVPRAVVAERIEADSPETG